MSEPGYQCRTLNPAGFQVSSAPCKSKDEAIKMAALILRTSEGAAIVVKGREEIAAFGSRWAIEQWRKNCK